MPAFVACPDDTATATVVVAITLAAAARGVATEYLDLRPAPAKHLDEVTARLRDFGEGASAGSAAPIRVLILDGFDTFEGEGHDAPIYPFRSRFQFDREHLWLFLGRDWPRLRRMFGSSRSPLYHAASDLTPEPWRVGGRPPGET